MPVSGSTVLDRLREAGLIIVEREEIVDSRLRRNPINASTWWQVWHKVRAASLTPEQLDGPLMRRPNDLRHAGVTRRLNEGVDEATVAA